MAGRERLGAAMVGLGRAGATTTVAVLRLGRMGPRVLTERPVAAATPPEHRRG